MPPLGTIMGNFSSISLPSTADLPFWVRLRHRWILCQWRRWAVPVLCFIPYVCSILWLIQRQLLWVAGVLLAPLVMGMVLIGLTWWLERQEFRRPMR